MLGKVGEVIWFVFLFAILGINCYLNDDITTLFQTLVIIQGLSMVITKINEGK